VEVDINKASSGGGVGTRVGAGSWGGEELNTSIHYLQVYQIQIKLVTGIIIYICI
jgi:hypothetical protein